MAKILLIEDDREITIVIRGWLQSQSHTVEVVHDGREGMDRLRTCQYDVILLDWELPNQSGIDILNTYRNEGGTTPILMMTGKRSVDEKEAGLDGGADDYLTKPFHMKELSARIRSLLRRASPHVQSNVLTVGDLVLDPAKHKLRKNGVEIVLLPKEFALLEFLMRHPDDVFSGEVLLQRVWHSESEATVEAIRTCIKRLRQKIDGDSEGSIIETLSRIGYRLRSG
jgi:two-component system OmpR family response regulator